MFCPSCGKSVNPGLSYCNHCGARVARKTENGVGRIPESSFNLLVIALIGVPIAGIGVIIGLLTVMKKELDFGGELIGFIVLMSFVLLLIAELGLIWLLRHHTKMSKRSNEMHQLTFPQPPDVVIKGLPESKMQPIRPMQSVTEHTTRTLDAVPREPRT
jgi:uncharacterized paraquat-inducible protein A